MKWRLIIALLFLFAFAADEKVRPEPFLHEGNVIRYSSVVRAEEGKKSVKMELRIFKVDAHNGHMRIEGVLHQYGANGKIAASYRSDFACDSLAFYADTENKFYRSANPTPGVVQICIGDSLIYPLNMKVGDTLSGANASEEFRSDRTSLSTRITYHDRVVAQQDTLALAFGKIPAFRIVTTVTGTSIGDYADFGKRHESSTYTLVEWFSPAYGIVKAEYKYPDGVSAVTMTGYDAR
jgi:hypothetical protein